MKLYINSNEARELMRLIEERMMILAGWNEIDYNLDKLYARICNCMEMQKDGDYYDKQKRKNKQ